MPSTWHDSANELFKENPELAGHILRDLMGVDLPSQMPLILVPGDFTDRPSRDLACYLTCMPAVFFFGSVRLTVCSHRGGWPGDGSWSQAGGRVRVCRVSARWPGRAVPGGCC